MALRHQFTIVCEFARLEMGGKWTIIGLFPNGIGTPQIPFPLPMLTFFQVFQPDAPGSYTLNASLRQIDGAVLANAKVQMQIGVIAPVVIPVALPNLQFKAFGAHTWFVEVEGQDEPFSTEFAVTHVSIPFRRMPPPPPEFTR